MFNAPSNFELKLSPQSDRQLRELLASMGLPAQPAADAAAPTTGFVGRLEYFGCLLYDRKNADYIPFDDLATRIFQLSQSMPLDRIEQQFPDEIDRNALHTFATLCNSIGILDAWGRFAGQFLPDRRTGAPVLSAPTLVRLALTNACNFRCGHCFTNAGNPYADELTTTQVLRLIDELADIGCLRLSLGGGEPLVRRDLPAIVARANRRGVGVVLTTNAVAATAETVASLAGLVFEEIAVSMDVADPTRHDAWRGAAGAFDQALRGIANLQSLGAPVTFRTLLHSDSVAGLADLIALAERLGIASIRFRSLLPAGRALQQTGRVLDREAMNASWRAIAAARAGTQVALHVPQQLPRTGKRVFEGFGDESARLNCSIDARGDVAPSGLSTLPLPADNLRRASLLEIWQRGAAFEQMRALQGNAMCRHCSEFRGCRGGCRDTAFLLTGNLEHADPCCTLVADAVARGLDARLAGALSVPDATA